MRSGYHRFGDFPAPSNARTAALASALRGEGGGPDGPGVESPARLSSLAAELGGRFPGHIDALAKALAGCALPEVALLRLLDAARDALAPVLADPVALDAFVQVASQSTLYGRVVARQPSLAIDAQPAIAESQATIERAVEAARAGTATEADTAAVARALRLRRRARTVAIIRDEVTQRRSVLQTAAAITFCAEEAISDACRYAVALRRADHLRLSVLGMGKLGSGELNFSSDIDLIFVTDPLESLANDEATIASVVRTIALLLDQVTADGVVYRVDLRLRPFGTQGPPAMTVGQMLNYYEAHGRAWERGALIRARTVGGTFETGERILALLRPFVWRRYIDVDAMRDVVGMKDRIDSEQSRLAAMRSGSAGYSVKLGRGGIREVEFFAQAFQLVYGGREPDLRERGTVPVLRRLSERGILAESDMFGQIEAYQFLRLVEHRIQMDEERQTHELPTDAEALRRLAWRFGFANEAGFMRRLDRHREIVHAAWSRLFAHRADAPVAPSPTPSGTGVLGWVDRALDERNDETARLRATAAAGFRDPARVLRDLSRLAGPPEPVVGAQSEPEVRVVAEQLYELAARAALPDQAADRLFDLLSNRRGRHSVFRICEREPRAGAVLVTLFGASESMGRVLVREPALVDTLLTDAVASGDSSLSLSGRLDEVLTASRDGLVPTREQRLQRMRRFRIVEELRVLLGELGGRVPLRQATLRLAELAAVCVEAVKREAVDEVRVRDPRVELEPLCCVAMGKLGARELGHHADLDLVFVVDAPKEELAGYAKVVQRWVSFITTPMLHGRLYELDTRLRPDGSQGALVTSIGSFEEYYAARAWAWERLALIRSRPIAAGAAASERIESIVESALDHIDLDGLADEMKGLRRKRIEGTAQRYPEVDVKLMAGGLADLEHVVHWLELTARRANAWPGRREGRSWDVIEKLAKIGVIREREAEELIETLEVYRGLEGWIRVTEGRQTTVVPSDEGLRNAVMVRVFDGMDPTGWRERLDSRRALVLDWVGRCGLGD